MNEDVYGFAKPDCERKRPNSAMIYALLASAFVESRSFLIPLYAAAPATALSLAKKGSLCHNETQDTGRHGAAGTAEQEEVYP